MVSNLIGDRIIAAFDPLIEVLQAVSYPIAFCMFAVGILLMIAGQQRQGLRVARMAALGYLLMQLLPAIMLLLRDIGQAMRQ